LDDSEQVLELSDKLANTRDCDGGSKLISLEVRRTCASQSN